MNFIRNLGFELPEYEAEQVIYSPNAMSKQVGESFIRRIFVGHGFKDMSICEALETTDTVFDMVAAYCGAVVVRHTWGLVPESYPDALPDSFGLPGYELVAEVEKVNLIYPSLKSTGNNLSRTLRSICSGATTFDEWQWYDARPEQFVSGSSKTYPFPTLHLTDIDLRLIRK